MSVDLEDLRALSDAATPGRWHAVLGHERGDYGSILSTYFDGVWTADGKTVIYRSVDDFGTDDYADGQLIAAAVNYVRARLAESES